MEKAIAVKFTDKRNFNLTGLKNYIALALPSMVFMMIDFSIMDAMVIIAGYLSFIDQVCLIIFKSIDL